MSILKILLFFCQQSYLIYIQPGPICTLFQLFSQRILCLSYNRWVLWESCQPWKHAFSIVTGLSHSGLSSSRTALVWSCQTPVPMPQFWKSWMDAREFMLVFHNVRQPVIRCGDGMSVEHTGPLFSCQMQWCCSVLHLEQVVDVLVELQKDIIIQQVNG